MLKEVDFYYFSPTGGTKKVGQCLANALAKSAILHDFADKKHSAAPTAELSIIALPVFGGRIPAFAAQKLKLIDGKNKKAVAIVVYGNRAYEDALLELNNLAKESFNVIACGAFVAQHSMYPKLGEGRPDEADVEELNAFAAIILRKLACGQNGEIKVPGNYPYKADFIAPATPVSSDSCCLCGKCAQACPTDAIAICAGKLTTDLSKCMLCMACVHACPNHARALPEPMQKQIQLMLDKYRSARRKNEKYI